MINFTRGMGTGVAATCWDIVTLTIEKDADTATAHVRGWLDLKSKVSGLQPLVDENVGVSGIAAALAGGWDAIEQLVLADAKFTGATAIAQKTIDEAVVAVAATVQAEAAVSP